MFTCSLVGISHTTVSVFGRSGLGAVVAELPSTPRPDALPPEVPSPQSPTLSLVRRSKYGWMSLSSCSQRCVFKVTTEGAAPRTLPASMGALKCFTKVEWLPRRLGCAKSKSAQRSCSEFCTGVPVRRMRHLALTSRTRRPSNVLMLLITCASSQMTTSQAFQDGSVERGCVFPPKRRLLLLWLFACVPIHRLVVTARRVARSAADLVTCIIAPESFFNTE
mmetsp:Transcript_91932/g.192232  ORF Transcript_91932/g.192232 Transcript_91932/m.192232 type:complete len:221 (+) Transcript_91932:2807-3469(+)